jgi:hypothetical protein
MGDLYFTWCMQNVISYKHMHECGCKILDIDSLFVTYGCFALDTWFELESDIIVVILKKKICLAVCPLDFQPYTKENCGS